LHGIADLIDINYSDNTDFQEDRMKKEIKRNAWARFCRKFSANNMFRDINISFNDKTRNNVELSGEYPLIGLTLEKKGRFIDGIILYAGQAAPEKLTQPVFSIKEPEKVVIEKNKDGIDCRLQVQTKNGGVATIELNGDSGNNRYQDFVREVAYSMYERRGFSHGNDMNDWLEAERKVKKAGQMFA